MNLENDEKDSPASGAAFSFFAIKYYLCTKEK